MKRRLAIVLGVALAVAVLATPARAQGFRELGFATVTADVTLTTTSETVIVSSGPVTAPRQTVNVCAMGWAQLTTGTNTTAVTPRIRRGTATSGTLVGEANAEGIKIAAAGTEPFFIMACEDRADIASVEYSLTLQQTAASANGSALQGGILVFVR